MDRKVFLSMADQVAARGVGARDRIGRLVLLNDGNCLKEPQLRQLWTDEAERKGFFYALEAPTHQKYMMTGHTAVSGRHDLMLYDTEPHGNLRAGASVIMEFKHGLSTSSVAGDLRKILTETAGPDPANAVIMIVSERVRRTTFERFLAELPKALEVAQVQVPKGPRRDAAGRWFECLMLVRQSTTNNTQPAGLYRATKEGGAGLSTADLWDTQLSMVAEPTEVRGRADD